MDIDSLEKIINFVDSDLEKNSELKDDSELKNVKNDLLVLDNIMRYPITSKMILKNGQLLKNLLKLYEADLKDPETTLSITNIIKKLTENSSNNEELLNYNPKIVSFIQHNLQCNAKQESDLEKQILNNDLAAFTNLVSENFRQLIDKKILSENDLKFVCELHSENPEYGPKLKAILDTINMINQEQAEQLKLQKDV